MATAGDYVIKRLQQQGVEALFGIPAVYCAEMFAAAGRAANFRAVLTASDLEAGYAADAYARIKGLAAVSVAYGVGTHSLVNAIAGAYIERSPVLVINGGPSDAKVRRQTTTGILFSHSMGRPQSDLDTFRAFTSYCERVTRKADIPMMVDKALASAITLKHPSYIEIPFELLNDDGCPAPRGNLDLSIKPGAAEAVAKEILSRLDSAKRPLVIVGIEIERYGLAARLLSVLNKLDLSWTTTLLAKSTLPEVPPRFLGVFNGEKAPPKVLDAIRDSDFIVALGAVFGSGHGDVISPKLGKMIRVWDGFVHRKDVAPQAVSISHLIAEFDRGADDIQIRSDAGILPRRSTLESAASDSEATWDGEAGSRPPEEAALTKSGPPVPAGLDYGAVFKLLNETSFFEAKMRLIVDTFLGVYAAAEFQLPSQNSFIVSALWATIGHSVAAAVGAAIPSEKRPVIVCGDGGFQVTGQAISTLARYRQNAIVIVVDNGMYGYEQYLLDHDYYKDRDKREISYVVLPRWDYVGFAKALGVSSAFRADDEASLRNALKQAKAVNNGPAVIHAVVKSKSLPASAA